MDLKETIDALTVMVDKYINDPTVEIEGRLGIYDENEKIFDSNIGDEFYKKINEMLVSGTGEYWRKTETTLQTDYLHKNMRLSVSDDASQRCITKERLESLTFILEGGNLDFRISASREVPIDTDKFPTKEKCKFIRQKQRQHFGYKMWDFDLTEVNSIQTDQKKKKKVIGYEYEIELNRTINDIVDTKYLCHSVLLKLLDAIGSCGKLEPDSKISLVKK
jgi:hypothetical protein